MQKLNGISSKTVEKATGKSWEDWIRILDKDNMFGFSHKIIAQHLFDNYLPKSWWAQMITVGYEKAKGLRDAYESVDGYQVSVSKTFPVSLAKLYEIFSDENQRKKWLTEKVEVTKQTSNKSIRAKWHDTSRLSIGFYSKGVDKSQVALGHEKIKNKHDVEKLRKFWKAKFEQIVHCL